MNRHELKTRDGIRQLRPIEVVAVKETQVYDDQIMNRFELGADQS
jgi:hypothetical protein